MLGAALVINVAQATALPDDALLDDASKQYCYLYTEELTHFMQTQGTPYDVRIMEDNIGAFKDGTWTIESETLSAKPDTTPDTWIVDVRCAWNSPLPDFNAPFEVRYRLRTDPDTGAIIDVTNI